MTLPIAMKKALAVYLMIWIVLLGLLPSNATAAFVPSDLSQIKALTADQREKDLSRIRVLLESKLISQRLTDLGFSSEEVQTRLASLPAEEVHQVAQRLDSLQTGGDSALGIIIALLVIAILVVILLQVTGHKIIVTK